jgi:hypothetical protein
VTESWNLKLDRAEHHLKEVADRVRQYSDSHPYEAIPVPNRRSDGDIRYFNLRVTSQPDEMLSVIVGDVVHNTRSALDHLMVGLVPRNRRRKTGFPIFEKSPFDKAGNPLDNDDGKRWVALTTGLKDRPLTIIRALQPFHRPPQETIDFCRINGLDPADINGLAMLSRFDNADKHRELVTVASGIEDGVVTVTINGVNVDTQLYGFREDGSPLTKVHVGSLPQQAKVHVRVRAVVRVALEVRKERGVTGLPGTLEKLIGHVRDICGSLGPLAG